MRFIQQSILRLLQQDCPHLYRPHHGNRLFERRFHGGKSNSTIMEIVGGVGGSEAMLFADDMLSLYTRYFLHMRWPYSLEELIKSELGGIRSAKLMISAPDAYTGLIQEAGVHRVQRVPKTEKYGRMHTSTVTVSVLPKSVLDVKINEKDLDMQTKRSSGAGGQHVNKTESAVRLLHRPTGVVVECQESRFQADNRKIAMAKLLEKIQQAELEKIASQTIKMRKGQVGHADRNEKIRTYNFPQDRLTDHRINKSYHNLRALFSGSEVTLLERLIHDYQNSKG